MAAKEIGGSILQEEERLTQLGWQLLELKFAYYYPSLLHSSWEKLALVSDYCYDILEDEYFELSKLVRGKRVEETIIGSMVGFDLEGKVSASCKLVAEKLHAERPALVPEFIVPDLIHYLF